MATASVVQPTAASEDSGVRFARDILLHPAAFKPCCHPGADRDASKPPDAATVHLR